MVTRFGDSLILKGSLAALGMEDFQRGPVIAGPDLPDSSRNVSEGRFELTSLIYFHDNIHISQMSECLVGVRG